MRRGMTRIPNPAIVAAQQEECLRYRLEGLSLRAIGELVGISHETVNLRIKAAIDERLAEPTQQVITYEIGRLDMYLEKIQPQVNEGDVSAINTALRIQERRARLLGLDQPVKVDATVTQVTQEDLALRDLISEARAREALDGGEGTGSQEPGGDDRHGVAGPADVGLIADQA